MGNLRVKGQETQLVVTGPTGKEEGFKAVESFEATLLLDILTENYLGELAPRFDEIFQGAEGSATVHLEDPQYMAFAQRVLDRAQRRNPGTVQFQILTSLEFPTGERVRTVFQDVKFGNIPIRSPGREDAVVGEIEWKCSEAKILF